MSFLVFWEVFLGGCVYFSGECFFIYVLWVLVRFLVRNKYGNGLI